MRPAHVRRVGGSYQPTRPPSLESGITTRQASRPRARKGVATEPGEAPERHRPGGVSVVGDPPAGPEDSCPQALPPPLKGGLLTTHCCLLLGRSPPLLLLPVFGYQVSSGNLPRGVLWYLVWVVVMSLYEVS